MAQVIVKQMSDKSIFKFLMNNDLSVTTKAKQFTVINNATKKPETKAFSDLNEALAHAKVVVKAARKEMKRKFREQLKLMKKAADAKPGKVEFVITTP